MKRLLAIACLALALVCDALAADIVIGRTLPLSGPIGAYGKAKMEGADLLINAVNAKGGIQGRKLVVVTLDDRYDPEQAVANVRALDGERKALVLLNALGVPAIAKLLPLLEELKLPGVGFSSGLAAVREPARRYVFPVRAGYREEAEHTVRQLRAIGFDRVAMVEQDDLFGKSVADAYRAAMQANGMRLSGLTKVLRDRPDVASAVATLNKAQPQAVLLALNALPAAAVVKAYREAGGAGALYAMSVTDATQMAGLAGERARGMAFSQIVPLPTSGSRRVVRDYLELAQMAKHAPSFYGLEGYVEARILVEALGKLTLPPTREAVVDMLGSFNRLDLGGFEVTYGSTARQGARFVEMVIIGPNGKLIK